MAEQAEIFDARFLRELEALDDALLRLRGQSGEGVARRGRSAGAHDFRGHRPYSPGDDLRRLDWNAYGRLGRFFMREFERERQEHVTLLLDASPSMAGPKHVAASRIAAAVAFLALRHGGSAALAGQGAVEGSARFGRFLDSLRAAGAEHGPLGPRLKALAAQGRAPSDLFVITDGLESLESFTPLSELSSRRTQVTLVLVLEPGELQPRALGAVSLRGREEQQTLTLQLDDALVAAYQAELQKHLQALQELSVRHGWVMAVADTGTSLRTLFLDKLSGGAP